MLVFRVEANEITIYQMALIAIIFLIVYLIITSIKKQFKNINYYREIPDNLHPAIIQYYSDGEFNNKAFWFILLNLIRSGYYKLERFKVEDDIDYKLKWQKDDFYNLDSYTLTDYEKKVIKYINTFIISNGDQTLKTILLSNLNKQIKADFNLQKLIDEIYSSLRHEIKYSYGFINRENNYLMVSLLTLVYYYILFPDSNYIIGGALYTAFILIISRVLGNTKFNLKGLFGILFLIYVFAILLIPVIPSFVFAKEPLSLLFIYLNPFLIFLTTYIMTTEMYSHKQSELMKKIHGSKMFLTDFTLLKYRPVDYINFVSYYYVLAEVYGIKITDQEYAKGLYDDDTFDTLSSIEFAESAFSMFGEFLAISLYK